MKIIIWEMKPIQYGVQLSAVSGNQKALVDFYSGSRKKSLVVKPGGDAELSSILQEHAEELKRLFLASSGPWTYDVEPKSKSIPTETICIWSDGGSKPNPGPGGYGVLIRYPDGRERELSAYDPDTTNNRMEMSGVIRGLQAIREMAGPVRIIVDSSYVMQGITSWIQGWRRKGWKTAAGKDVLNRDLWECLDSLVQEREVTWEWVKGHSGHPENERCDRLATEARKKARGVEREAR